MRRGTIQSASQTVRGTFARSTVGSIWSWAGRPFSEVSARTRTSTSGYPCWRARSATWWASWRIMSGRPSIPSYCQAVTNCRGSSRRFSPLAGAVTSSSRVCSFSRRRIRQEKRWPSSVQATSPG